MRERLYHGWLWFSLIADFVLGIISGVYWIHYFTTDRSILYLAALGWFWYQAGQVLSDIEKADAALAR